ncbi:MAG: PAS domain S-box protein [Polaromonas sp.]|nr:PAS domain S-box protein [Polaromonas sp.]
MKITLRTRLVLMVMVGLVPLLGLALFEAWNHAEAAISQASRHQQSTIALAAAHQQRVLESAQQILLAIASAPGLVNGKPEDCQRYLKTLNDQLPVYGNLGLISPDGFIRCDGLGNRQGVFVGDRDYVQAAFAQRRFVISGYIFGRASGKPIVVFAMPATDSQGKVSALAFVSVDLSEIAKAVVAEALPPASRLVITDRQGIVLAVSPKNPAMVGQPVPNPFLRDAVKTMRAGAGEGPDSQGRQQLFAFMPIGAAADAPFFAAISTDKAGVLVPVWQELGLEFTLAVLVAFLGGWIAWRMGARAIVAPTEKILEATRQIQQGRLDLRIPISAADEAGEFSRIAAGFNRMAESLRKHHGELAAELVRSRVVQEKMQDAQQLGRIGYWQSDLDTRTVWWSDEVYDVLGVDRALLGNTYEGFLQLVHPDDREAYGAGRDGKFRSGIPRNIEFRIVTSAGEVRWIHQFGRAHVNAEGEQGRHRAGVLQDITERKQTEEMFRKSNDLLKLIVENAPIRIFWKDLELRYLGGNTAFAHDAGLSNSKELIGKDDYQMPWREQADLYRSDDRRVIDSDRPKLGFEEPQSTPDGHIIWLRTSKVPIHDAAGKVNALLGIYEDITERKLAEQELIDSEQRYAALFEAAPVPIYVYDVATNEFLAVNQATIKSYGYSAEEFRLMTLFDIRPESEHASLRQTLTEQVRWRKGTWQHLRKDGSVFPVEVFSKSVQHAGRAARFVVALDISDQVKAEKEVAEHLFMLQRAADAAQAITWHQTLQGTLQEVAEQSRGVIGAHQAAVSLNMEGDWAQAINALSLSEKYDQYRDLIEPMDGSGIHALVSQSNRALRLTQAELEAHPRWRGFGRYADKHPPMRGWLAVPLTARDGKNIGLLQLSDKYEGEFTQQDEYVALEMAQMASSAMENARLIEEVNQLNTRLEQKVAERTLALRLANQELEAFSYSVSHDLRSPLNTIDGFSQLLAKQLAESDNDKARHYLSRIRAGTAQMGQLIADLLSLARVSRAQLRSESVDLSALARGILGECRARQPERQLALHVESDLQAQGDAGLLRVVLENLLGNACKFSSLQAQAEISVGQKLDAAGEPVFFVQDNGAGFDMAYADKLFQPFQRLHAVAEFPGTGIGLATVSRVIERHGGRLWADAAPGCGATFFFTLPKVALVV